MTDHKPRRALRRALALTVMALAGAAGPVGCGDEGRTLDWDLAADRSISSVDWKGTEDTFTIRNVRRVRIRLPGGLVIDEREPRSVVVGRGQDQVSVVVVQLSEDESAEAAHRRAKAAAERYHFDDPSRFDGWLEEERERAATGDRHRRPGVRAGNGVLFGSPEKPEVFVDVDFTGIEEAPSWGVQLTAAFTP